MNESGKCNHNLDSAGCMLNDKAKANLRAAISTMLLVATIGANSSANANILGVHAQALHPTPHAMNTLSTVHVTPPPGGSTSTPPPISTSPGGGTQPVAAKTYKSVDVKDTCGTEEEIRLGDANAIANGIIAATKGAPRKGDSLEITLGDGNVDTWEYLCGGTMCAGTIIGPSPTKTTCKGGSA
jgi:hypothetical protein